MTLAAGSWGNHPHLHTDDRNSQGRSHAFPDGFSQIPQARGPHRPNHPDGQSALIDACAGDRLGESCGKSRADLLEDPGSVQGAAF
jgi:hypothetical protein